MSGNWVRDRQVKPKERRVVLVYKPDDPTYREIEALLEVIPYGKGNKMLLEALRFGCAATLKQIQSGHTSVPQQQKPVVQPVQIAPQTTQPVQAQQAQQTNQGSVTLDTSDPRTNGVGSASFTPAALDMLEMGGRGK